MTAAGVALGQSEMNVANMSMERVFELANDLINEAPRVFGAVIATLDKVVDALVIDQLRKLQNVITTQLAKLAAYAQDILDNIKAGTKAMFDGDWKAAAELQRIGAEMISGIDDALSGRSRARTPDISTPTPETSSNSPHVDVRAG